MAHTSGQALVALGALGSPTGTRALPPRSLSLGPGTPTRAFAFQVRSDRDKFVIFLDVKHFSPEDLTVKVQEDFVEIHGKHNERQVRGPRARAPRPAGGALVPDPGASRGRGRRRPGRGCPGSPHLPGGGSRSSPGNARSREPSLGGGAVATARAALTDAPSASPVLAVTSQRPSAPGAPVLASRQVAQPSAGPWPAGPAVGTRGAGACGSRGAAPGGGGVSGRAGTGARGS